MSLASLAVDATSDATHGVAYGALVAGVLLGSIVPVVPTGTLVSGAAAVAVYSGDPLRVLLVVGVASGAALLGDLVLFALFGTGSGRLQDWLRRKLDAETLDRTRRRLDRGSVRVLIVARLIPAGRVPVLVAAVAVGLGWRRFVIGDAAAASVWALSYSAIGIAGGSLFDEPWQGVLVAVAAVLAISGVATLLRRITTGNRTSDV